ncbi:MAG: nitrite reductase large subunit NirB [Proteobacteria bacterium]|nr:nitrite reductase large subunit NirB [Pseudomonadota bacterium]
MTRRIVVVGHGMVGHRFCESLRERDGGEHELVVFGEEPRPAYDRVHLSEFFGGRGAEELALTSAEAYREQSIELVLGDRVVSVDPGARRLETAAGRRDRYDALVLATGSAPFVPPLPGRDLEGVFVYRTVEDLEAIRAWAEGARAAAVIGGGLLGLEAAKAVRDLGLEAHVVEFAPRLMPRQVDAGGGRVLRRVIESLGVAVRVDARTEALIGEGRVAGLRFADGSELAVDMVIVSAGIRPRDELARQAGLAVGERGGVIVDSRLSTSAADVYAIGECALHAEQIYGLVGPGYEMADVLARRLTGEDARFEGADLSTKLKLLGVDVASFGDPFADASAAEDCRSVVFEDEATGVYQKLLVSSSEQRLLGGILVGDAAPYADLLTRMRRGDGVPERAHELLFGAGSDAPGAPVEDEDLVCSCNNVTAGAIRCAVGEGQAATLGELKACTKAGTGCGGCVPVVAKLLEAELERAGVEVDRNLCEHFAYTRQQLFDIVKVKRLQTFDALLASHGAGQGCEVCRPAVASILASTWNEPIVNHATIQDTNDRFLANIQRGGTYSVIPRVPGGEITPEKLIVLGQVARKYDLYCKITGGQRIDLLGARVEQLPDIWQELVRAGFESGHAYGKAMRTVKSCIGSTWCRYGVQDSTAMAIRIEERYRGLRAPHKLKSAVSGCIRECAEAQSKDFGVIATDKGWNLYLGGNGGSNPRHADLVASDLDDDELIRAIDRFLMYYIHTANPLERTARWVERIEGGMEAVKRVVLDDELGICEQLEADMQALVDGYQCEWKLVVEDPERRRAFRHFANDDAGDGAVSFVRERDQRRPADWPSEEPAEPVGLPPESLWTWVPLARAQEVPADGGIAARYGAAQIAIFHFAARGEWYATQATCPHRKDNVLARGLLGSQAGEPKVACPLHKKTFSLESGKGLNDPNYSVLTFPVEVRGGRIFVKLPPSDALASALPCRAR